MPDNREIDYKGYTKDMTPREFLDLAAPMHKQDTNSKWIADRISEGKSVAPPILYTKWNEATNTWEVVGHEGRHRSKAIHDFNPETKMPVAIIPQSPGWMRARHITDEMKKAQFKGEKP